MTLNCFLSTSVRFQLEISRLESKLAERQSERPDVKQEQRLTNLISRTVVKQDAAQSVYFTYTNIVSVLREVGPWNFAISSRFYHYQDISLS